jgi:hypothetical protein
MGFRALRYCVQDFAGTRRATKRKIWSNFDLSKPGQSAPTPLLLLLLSSLLLPFFDRDDDDDFDADPPAGISLSSELEVMGMIR